MNKLILRLLVSGVIVAGIVVAVILIFFQTPKLEDAYNNLHAGIDTNGEITEMVGYLNDETIKSLVEQSFGNELKLFNGELNTLVDNYSKLHSVKEQESKLAESLAENVNVYLKNVKDLNVTLKNIKDSTDEVGDEINSILPQMIENAKNEFTKQVKQLCKINSDLIDVLLDTYYNGIYDLPIALDSITTILANQYYKVEDTTGIIAKYSAIASITNKQMQTMLDSSDDTLSPNGDYSNSTTYFIYNLRNINLKKLLTVKDYIESLDENTKVIATNIKAYIDNLN